MLYLLLLLAMLYGLLNAGIYALQDYIVFQPKRLPADHRFDFDHPCEEVRLTTSDGERITGLYFPTGRERKGVLLYLHGNYSHLQRWGNYHSAFTRRGYDVFMIDYRGYGKSTGRPTEKGFYLDGEAAYAWLRERVPAKELILYGRSLGSGVACYLAARHPARMLLLETPFDSITGALQRRFPFLFFPKEMTHNFPNRQYLRQVQYPVYIFHGTWDEIVPYSAARQLKPLLADTARFLTVKQGMHKNLHKFDAYQQALDRILGQ